jgi:glycosyltransferase involved in cell wall biosynthesis
MVSLLLIGIYPPKEVLETAAEDIHVLGPVEDIGPYLEQAAVVVAPLRIGGGMRMKVLHSLAIGKAVVTTGRGADGLAVAGVKPPLVIGDTAQDFAGAVAGLLSDRGRRIELGAQARKFAETYYSAQAYARRIEAIYTEMTEEGNL